jgi:lysine-specific histone demethylase 1
VEQPPTPISQAAKHNLEPEPVKANPYRSQQRTLDEEYEASIMNAILVELGERPVKPARSGTNPFLLFTKDHWYSCKNELDEERRAATGKSGAKATRTEIRAAVGLKWRTASDEVKKPYIDVTRDAKDDAAANGAAFKERLAAWDMEAARIRREFVKNNPPPDGNEHLYTDRSAAGMSSPKRTRRA